MKLTDQQTAFFENFGYLVIRQLLSPDEVDRVIEAFEWSILNWGGGGDHDGTKRTMFVGPIEHSPDLCALVDHPGIMGLIGGVTGEDFNYCGGDGNYYTGDTGWHPDGNWGQLWATKTAFYLDRVRRDSGCLRVIPGSHQPDHFVRRQEINVNESEALFGIPPDEFPGNIALEADPGDVVIFNHDLYHASFGGGSRRRMFTMNFSRRYPEDRLQELRDELAQEARFWIDRIHGEAMIRTAGPERMVHLEQVMANDTHLADLSREMKKIMDEPARK